MGEILEFYYGKITAETLYKDIVGLMPTGNTQVCVFDVYEHVIYLAYSEYGTNEMGFKRSMMYIDLKEFWKPF